MKEWTEESKQARKNVCCKARGKHRQEELALSPKDAELRLTQATG